MHRRRHPWRHQAALIQGEVGFDSQLWFESKLFLFLFLERFVITCFLFNLVLDAGSRVWAQQILAIERGVII